MSGYFALTGQVPTDAGGRLIMTLGDACLAAFPGDAIDAGVCTFQVVQSQGSAWLIQRGYKSDVVVKLHLGPVAIGRVGNPGEEILDLHGKTVNIAAALSSTGLTSCCHGNLQAKGTLHTHGKDRPA